MKRLFRRGAMILLFLLLANCPWGANPLRGTGVLTDVCAQDVGVRWPIYAAEERSSSSLLLSWDEDVSCSHYRANHPPTTLQPDLQRALRESDDTDMIHVIVSLRQQSDIDQIEVLSVHSHVEAGIEVVSRLQATADATQAPLRSYLAGEQAAGRVSSYETFWITNAIAVRARPSVVRALATHCSVEQVSLDHRRQWVSAERSDLTRQTNSSHLARDEGQPAGPRDGSPEWNVSRIRADEVWHTLSVSGTGAVVAGVDTGADWFHPALRDAYRGYSPHGLSDHMYSWFDATAGGAVYPVDGHGHGSHTLGTIVGGDGIGVAPGARWIAVRVLNNQGYGYDSWIHAGFQWLLAPGGDPRRAPDVANCSWGNSSAYLTTFQDDLRALRAAGILPVFASGNGGPGTGTVDSPASLPEAFAVGAVDSHDVVATFSGRGPSPWGEIRPHVAAPGVHIRSSVPGGAYEETNGTSMAAPHVSGVAALIRSISPTLSITGLTRAITSTAVPLGSSIPNNDTGWGRVDAFAAVAAVARPGFITGTVRTAPSDDPEGEVPIAGARVSATSRAGSGGIDITDSAGTYSLALTPAVYDMMVSAFGHESKTVHGIDVVTDTTTVRDVSLTPVPTGALDVFTVDASSDEPLTATVEVLGTPYGATTDAATFELPPGDYTIRAERVAYRVVTATATIRERETSIITLCLPPAPSLLLVDSGGWYYESQIEYFRQALDDLSYAYDEWSIRDLWQDVPTAADLARYDVVVWSAPRDAPGLIGAGTAVASYLRRGGRLFLTGQDVGYYDGGWAGYQWSSYYHDYLKVRVVGDNAPARVLIGESSDVFSGQTLTIAGPGGANNQDYPDVISIADSDAAAPVLRYQGDGCGGARIGTCLGYRALYLSFGFEAINESAARREVMKRALDWLTASPPTAGLELKPRSQLAIGPPGSRVTHTVRLRHIGQSGDIDHVRLTLDGVSWATELSESSLTLAPCASTMITISVTIPTTATWDLRNVLTLTAQSSLSPTVSVTATLESKAPAPVLLVDDDRWYDQQATYRDAMESAGFRYDVWETATAGGGHGPGPRAETLARYPVVVWWTGYDWYAPLIPQEVASLSTYLDDGGRLMLSSQDFLYDHYDEPFAREYLGVLTYTESITPTRLEGVPENPVGATLGPWPLAYPDGYQNWSDGMVPGLDVGVAFRDQGLQGAALTHRRGSGATVFLAFPFEALPVRGQSLTMERAVGWLSWLGQSTFTAEPRSAMPGDTVTYTLNVRNDGPEVVTASVANAPPAGVKAEWASLEGPGRYDPVENRLLWRGLVHPGQAVTLSYPALVVTHTTNGAPIVNVAQIRLKEHDIAFARSARVRVAAPDLSGSAFGCVPSTLRSGDTSTCTVTLDNAGPADASRVTALINPPGTFGLAADSLWASDGVIHRQDGALTWSGPLMASSTATLTFQLATPSSPVRETLYGVMLLDDGVGGKWERPVWLVIEPWPAYLPVVTRAG